jgi:integrase
MPRHGENVKQLPNGRWQISYRKLDGKEIAKTFDRKVDASRWRREGLAARDRGEYIDPRAARVTVRDRGEQHRTSQLHHRELTSRHVEGVLRLHVYPHIGDKPISRVLRTDIEALVKRWVADGAAPRTIRNSRFAVVQTLFRAAVKDGLIRKSPCDGIKLPEIVATKIVPLTAEQVEALADAIDPRLRALVLLGYGCGTRISEALGLTEPNVGWFTGEVAITQQLGPRAPYPLVPLKNSRRRPSRVVPMPQYVHEALSRHIEVYGLGERDLVFTALRGGPLNASRGGLYFRAASQRVGLPDSVSFHTLRHSYASEALVQGLSTVEVAELIGDSVAMVEKTYGHPTVDFRKRARLAVEAAWASRQDAVPAVADAARTAGLAPVRDLR